MKPQFLEYDSLDDRREIHHLLSRLPRPRRLEWLRWCCANAVLPNSQKRPVVNGTTRGHAIEVFMDFWLLSSQYTVNVDFCVSELVKMVRQPLYRPQMERGKELVPRDGLFISGLA